MQKILNSKSLPLNGRADFYTDDTIRISFRLTPREDVHNLLYRKSEIEDVFTEVLAIYGFEHAEWDAAIHDNWMVTPLNLYEEGGEV